MHANKSCDSSERGQASPVCFRAGILTAHATLRSAGFPSGADYMDSEP